MIFICCTGSWGCGNCGKALADLITEFAIEGAVTIFAGQPLDIPSAVENVINTVQECSETIEETSTANSSESKITIDFDSNGDGSFNELVENANFGFPEIPGGMAALRTYTTTFNDPGEYQLITFADDGKDVEERNENNNESAPEILDTGRIIVEPSERNKKPLIIRVLPNPDFEKPPGAKKVEIVAGPVSLVEM